MLDLSGAQLEPHRALHFFHERLNVHIKCSTAGAILLVNQTTRSSNPRELGNVIRASHPAWNTPPIHEMDLLINKQLYGAVGVFAIVSLFSALDDFIDGVEADISRHTSYGNTVTTYDASKVPDEEDKVHKLYVRYGWSTKAIARLLPALKYFRHIRNCIAHRSSRCSKALAELSVSDEVTKAMKPLLDRTTKSHPTFSYEDEILVEPTLAIACSDVLRKICGDCNRQYISTIGHDSFLRIVMHNLLFKDKIVRTAAGKTPEAVLNFALSDRYRVPVTDRLEPAGELKRIGVWKEFFRQFKVVYS